MPARPLIVFESPATESVLRQNGLGTLDAIFERRDAAQIRHVGRAVWKTELQGPDGKAFTAFVKLSWGRRRWWPRLADIRTGQVLKSLAVREWEGLAVFERLGLQVPERLAILEEGLLWKRSALFLRAVPPPASLSDMILDGSWLRLPLTDRGMILEEFARKLCRIHGSGWAWRSISTRHVFPQRDASGGWELWLIDCEGVHRARSAETLRRDLRRFMRALSHDRADERTLELMQSIGSRCDSAEFFAESECRSKRDRSAA
jgi:lipopolysaccharide kinase (Kdo/WaaP) family protein